MKQKNKKKEKKKAKAGAGKEKKEKMLGDPVIRFFLMMTVVANIIEWLLVFVMLVRKSATIVLHYNAYFGVDLDGDSRLAFLLPGAGFLLLAFNYLLGFYFMRRDKVVSRLLVGTAFLFNLVIGLAITALIFVNRV